MSSSCSADVTQADTGRPVAEEIEYYTLQSPHILNDHAWFPQRTLEVD